MGDHQANAASAALRMRAFRRSSSDSMMGLLTVWGTVPDARWFATPSRPGARILLRTICAGEKPALRSS